MSLWTVIFSVLQTSQIREMYRKGTWKYECLSLLHFDQVLVFWEEAYYF